MQTTRPLPLDGRGLVRELVEAESVGQPTGRVDGHHTGVAAPLRRLEGERRRRGRLAHATRSAADDDRALVHHRIHGRGGRGGRGRGGAHEATSAGRRNPSIPAGRRVAQGVDLGRADGRCEEVGDPQLVERELAGQAGELFVLQPLADHAEPPGVVEGADHIPGRSTPAWAAASAAGVAPRTGRIAAVHDEGPEGYPHPVLEGEGGIDDLVDRHLLGQRDEDHLAACRSDNRSTTSAAWTRIGTTPGGVEQTRGRRQEGQGVPGRRSVHEDDVGQPVALDLFDLPQHQDVPDAGMGRPPGPRCRWP